MKIQEDGPRQMTRNGCIVRMIVKNNLNLTPVSTTPVVPVANFVVDTGGPPSLANIFANFQKKYEMTLMLFSGACPFKAKINCLL
jgi:hypothetical protein